MWQIKIMLFHDSLPKLPYRFIWNFGGHFPKDGFWKICSLIFTICKRFPLSLQGRNIFVYVIDFGVILILNTCLLDVHEKVENTENIDEDHHQESDSPDHLLTDYHAEQSISENTENILPDPDENPDDFLSENLMLEENVDEDESASDNQNPDNQAEF